MKIVHKKILSLFNTEYKYFLYVYKYKEFNRLQQRTISIKTNILLIRRYK